MPTSLLPIISYILISSFTPGPANVSSASMAVLHGFRPTFNFRAGLAAGVFLLMLLSGVFSTTLFAAFPPLEPLIRYVGAVYILYLAFGILKASYTFTETDVQPLGFMHGFTLQILNPKLIVYAFTLFSAFLAPIAKNAAFLLLAVVLLAGTAFCATSVWALFGTTIKRYLHHPRVNRTINILLALSLVYTAISLIGLI